jgi:hypothetical protein
MSTDPAKGAKKDPRGHPGPFGVVTFHRFLVLNPRPENEEKD